MLPLIWSKKKKKKKEENYTIELPVKIVDIPHQPLKRRESSKLVIHHDTQQMVSQSEKDMHIPNKV